MIDEIGCPVRTTRRYSKRHSLAEQGCPEACSQASGITARQEGSNPAPLERRATRLTGTSGPPLGSLFVRGRNITWEKCREPVRFGLQSAAGAVLTYAVVRALGLPELSWAVISAVFVTHQNLDATFRAAMGRIGGTLLGSVVGLAAVLLLPGADDVGWRLAAVALAMNGLAVMLPTMQYGVVAAAVIVLPGGSDAWAGAVDRGVAISVGTLVGTACTFIVWPESATKRASRAIMGALTACADLLDTDADALMRDEKMSCDDLHRRFLTANGQARELVTEAQCWSKSGRNIRALIEANSRLWHTLIILDRLQRAAGRRAPIAENEMVRSRLAEMREQVCAALKKAQLGQHLDLEPASAAIRCTIEATREDTGKGGLAPLTFALEELICDLEALDQALSRC
ncbi:FUSC family protein [Novosphingobium sp. M1R2S20]|uniref:FUSC family protein n=1 Tax=Novosphingobium rhizovicinum TaxID=3228928 RepID=A0ABV3RB02_9SPHN